MLKYGLIGEKLGHSFSKEIHSMIADYDYNLLEMDRTQLNKFLEERNFKAVNVTIPYKNYVISLLDEVTTQARNINAVNCIKNENGRLIGTNTDFDGLKALIDHAKIKVENKKVLILGTGGTSDTALAVCKSLKAREILKVSRNKSITYQEAISHHQDAQIIINTTPCGMYPDIFQSPIELIEQIDIEETWNFPHLEGVVDVIYNPIRSKLVLSALKRGIASEGGLYMLVAQAVKASEFFLSKNNSTNLIDEIYSKIYKEKSNIVLIGMPSCGKSTIGKILSQKTNRKLLDTDSLIEQKMDMTIAEIFNKYGEKYFRDIEAAMVKEVSRQNGIIIATGGGVILKKPNVEALKMNGTIFFIDKDPEQLTPTQSRPTALDKEAILKRYKERYEIYKLSADCVIKCDKRFEEIADIILEKFYENNY